MQVTSAQTFIIIHVIIIQSLIEGRVQQVPSIVLSTRLGPLLH